MPVYYAGIGSRETPDGVLETMKEVARILAHEGWILRSGGADGADLAFEDGCDNANGQKEIFLPWKGFNKNKSSFVDPTREMFDMAREIHAKWEILSMGSKKLHARNCAQVLGYDLNTPSSVIICWTVDGKTKGGTATAIKIADKNGIPVINLGKNEFKNISAQEIARIAIEKAEPKRDLFSGL